MFVFVSLHTIVDKFDFLVNFEDFTSLFFPQNHEILLVYSFQNEVQSKTHESLPLNFQLSSFMFPQTTTEDEEKETFIIA